MRALSHLTSWLFLPLFMPLYALMIAMFIPSVEQSFFQENTLYWMAPAHKFAVLSMFGIFSFAAPGITLILLMRSKIITTIEMDDHKERGIPLAITAIYCLILALFLFFKAPNNVLPFSIYALPWGGFVAISIAGIVNKKDKISLHAIGVGMFVGFFCSYFLNQIDFYFEIIIFSVIIAGAVMSARVYLGKHTLPQVVKGFALGFLCVFISILFFNY
jgi:membrane-associated phospholipid phosphatase